MITCIIPLPGALWLCSVGCPIFFCSWMEMELLGLWNFNNLCSHSSCLLLPFIFTSFNLFSWLHISFFFNLALVVLWLSQYYPYLQWALVSSQMQHELFLSALPSSTHDPYSMFESESDAWLISFKRFKLSTFNSANHHIIFSPLRTNSNRESSMQVLLN